MQMQILHKVPPHNDTSQQRSYAQFALSEG